MSFSGFRSSKWLLLAGITTVLSVQAMAQVEKPLKVDPVQEKLRRNAARQKIDSHLLLAIEAQRSGSLDPGSDSLLLFDEKRRVKVSIRATVTSSLLARIRKERGSVVSTSVRYHDIQAFLPLNGLVPIASLKNVSAIVPAEQATTNKQD